MNINAWHKYNKCLFVLLVQLAFHVADGTIDDSFQPYGGLVKYVLLGADL